MFRQLDSKVVRDLTSLEIVIDSARRYVKEHDLTNLEEVKVQ